MSLIASKTFVLILKFTLIIMFVVSIDSQALQIEYKLGAENKIPKAIVGKGNVPSGIDIAYFEEDPQTKGYLAEPQGVGSYGGVILIHEWNGLVDRVRQVADVLAVEGYVVLAVDLYSGRIGSNRKENMLLVRETLDDMDEIIRNLDSATEYLRARPDVNGKVGTVGWCYGGGIALSYALGGINHEATAIFYGNLLADPEQLKLIKHEIYGTFAGLDRGPSPQQVAHFVTALRQAGVDNDIHIYDDVHHGFWLWAERDPGNLAPALDAWIRLKTYLKRTLGSGS